MNELLLVLFVFAAVVMVVWAVAAGLGGASSRRLRTRLDALSDTAEAEQAVSAIRARYLKQLTPFERQLEQLPGMALFGHLIEQAGWTSPAYRVAMLSVGLGLAAAVLTLAVTRFAPVVIALPLFAASVPLLKARSDRDARLEKFEGQLPDALDLMSRSLRAGNPLMESFKFVSEEMKPPISNDFGRAWSNVNYGVSLKASLTDLLERTPSVSLRSLATAILVQRETGGNLAEILDKITNVLRGRAKFQRKVRTLTAEGKMSGWILGLLPFATGGMMSIMAPDNMVLLFTDPAGRRMVMTGLILMVIGAFWISRIVKIRV